MTEYDVRGYAEVGGEDRSDLPGQLREQRQRVAVRLAGVERVVAVMSGKGGVGKSLVAASLAAGLAEAGSATGLLDADLDSPTGARMLDARDARLRIGDDGVRPPEVAGGVRLVSTDLVLDEDVPLEWEGPDGDDWVWRGAQERGVLREFLSDVAWGELDVLVVDLPPGTSRFDQLVGLVPELAGVVFVTIPSGASASSVRRSMRRARDRGVEVLGVVENMSGYACAECGARGELFPGDAGRELAGEAGVPLLGRVPFDPHAASAADAGRVEELLHETGAGAELLRIAERVG